MGDAPFRPCIWCGAPTDVRFISEAHPELGVQPLHMLCAADLLMAFEAFRAGRQLKTRWVKRLAGYQQLLTSAGHAAVTALQRAQVNE